MILMSTVGEAFKKRSEGCDGLGLLLQAGVVVTNRAPSKDLVGISTSSQLPNVAEARLIIACLEKLCGETLVKSNSCWQVIDASEGLYPEDPIGLHTLIDTFVTLKKAQ